MHIYLKKTWQSPRVVLDSKIIYKLEYSGTTEFIKDMNKSNRMKEVYNTPIGYLQYCFNENLDDSRVSAIEQGLSLFIVYLSPIVEDNNKDLLISIINNIESNIYLNTTIYKRYRWVSDYFKMIINRKRKE